MIYQLLVKEKFEEWLGLWNEDTVVGVSNVSNECPLAKYIRSYRTIKNDNILEVTSVEVVIYHTPDYIILESALLPAWARLFVERVDLRYKTITASDCLKILKENNVYRTFD